MTPAEAVFWRRLMRRVALLEPDMVRPVFKALEILRGVVSEASFTRLIVAGDTEGALALLDDAIKAGALSPVSAEVARQTQGAVATFGKVLPLPASETAGIVFNVLNPRMVDAVRALDTKVVQVLTDDVKATVRQVTERGIRAGVNPRETARSLRDVIGLGPTQEKEVDNFRAALEGRDGRNPFDYAKRDRRFDASIRKGTLTPAQIDKQVDIYRKRRIALNAETVARTAALDAQKAGQRMAWESAIERGIVERGDLLKRWAGTLDSRERQSHLDMEGETVGCDDLFSNGQLVPGDTEYNCRCLAVYFVRRAAPAPKRTIPASPTVARTARPAASESGAVKLERALAEAEDKIRNLPYEHGYAFTSDGAKIYDLKGTKSRVPITREHMLAHKNGHFTHNHPNGHAGFSSGDFMAASEGNVQEMRSVTNRGASSIVRGRLGWNSPSQMKMLFKKFETLVMKERPMRPSVGGRYVPSPEEIEWQQTFYLKVAERMAKHLGPDRMTFTFYPR
jgi:hypothetical protein